MAWLSVGTSNDDLCAKLVENGVLHEGQLLEAFRFTDRGDFVEEEDRLQAYADRPFKKGKIHLSAPHMYVTVLEALDLQTGKSFLNIGSGSGYLSCLAAYLLGEEGVSHGVELSDAACSFSKERARMWHAKLVQRFDAAARSGTVIPGGMIPADGISFVNANCFDLDVLSAAHTLKYDRIYVGAGCPDSRKEFFLSMLGDNGVMVVPINERNQMLAIRKFCGRVYSAKPISNVNFAPLLDTAERPDEQALLGELAALEGQCLRGDLQECIRRVQAAPSSASFIIHPLTVTVPAPAPAHPATPLGSPASSSSSSASPGVLPSAAAAPQAAVHRIRLPSLVWAPQRARHMQFPLEFRRAVFTILLANNRSVPRYCNGAGNSGGGGGAVGAVLPDPRCNPQCQCRSSSRVAAGCYLPHQIWLQVFSFANREWFYPPKSELQAVSTELAVERRLRRAAEDRLRRAEASCRDYERKFHGLELEVQRLRRRCSTTLTPSALGGTYLHGPAAGGLAAYMDLLVSAGAYEDDEEDYGEEDEEEEEQSEIEIESESAGEEDGDPGNDGVWVEAEDHDGMGQAEDDEGGEQIHGTVDLDAEGHNTVVLGVGEMTPVLLQSQEGEEDENAGEELVQLGVYGHAPLEHEQVQEPGEGEPMVVVAVHPDSPALTSNSSAGSGGEGVWIEVGDQEGGPDGDGDEPSGAAAYWSAYRGYLQAMKPGRGNGGSSYGSTLTGTTAESLGSYFQLGASASVDGNGHGHPRVGGPSGAGSRSHSHSFGGERLSDFSVDAASWDEDGNGVGSGASADNGEAFFPADDDA